MPEPDTPNGTTGSARPLAPDLSSGLARSPGQRPAPALGRKKSFPRGESMRRIDPALRCCSCARGTFRRTQLIVPMQHQTFFCPCPCACSVCSSPLHCDAACCIHPVCLPASFHHAFLETVQLIIRPCRSDPPDPGSSFFLAQPTRTMGLFAPLAKITHPKYTVGGGLSGE